ncbi:MAG: tRNA (5-methylaminomethyl-2-thiouridine)(34)-methyltransferase MnmD [Bacteroidetes bacterium]|nr:tRNA (5-methylaminomethyl-2-thiouridine)(34)-methyltransferase MnmD [Bacteroidota bacterium]
MDSNELQLIITDDGSHTLYVPSLQETYHSKFGAIQESRHIFINEGLGYWLNRDQRKTKTLCVLEVGFGTGLNALLSAIYMRDHPEICLRYHALEPKPLSGEITKKLNYCRILHSGDQLWDRIHECKWGSEARISNNFRLFKDPTMVADFKNPYAYSYDLVFFDAFAPCKQPELWNPSVFEKIRDSMAKGGYLVTYCARGQFKRDLKSLGFNVQTLPGPSGKLEMVRAGKGASTDTTT